MSLSSFSIKRPVTTIMIYSALILMGIIALTRLPVELYPDISFGQISIIIYIRGGGGHCGNVNNSAGVIKVIVGNADRRYPSDCGKVVGNAKRYP